MEVENYKRLGLHERFQTKNKVNGRSNMELLEALAVPEDAQYNPCTAAFAAESVPPGRLEMVRKWTDTQLFAGTHRDVALYAPAHAEKNTALPVMVFNDGLGYCDPDGPVRATQVLDTLIHAGDIPAMAAVFVMPGRVTDTPQAAAPEQVDQRDMDQRSFEYDSVTPLYGQFLLEELLPSAAQHLGLTFSDDPTRRAICGISSGGICAFNTAWHHPQAFGLVVSHCGSFVNIRGGHNFPYLIRATPRKKIRTFLTSGKRDGDIIFGNWPLANQQMASALAYAGYDYRFEFGEGGHSLRHGGALFGDTMRWLWRNE